MYTDKHHVNGSLLSSRDDAVLAPCGVKIEDLRNMVFIQICAIFKFMGLVLKEMRAWELTVWSREVIT